MNIILHRLDMAEKLMELMLEDGDAEEKVKQNTRKHLSSFLCKVFDARKDKIG